MKKKDSIVEQFWENIDHRDFEMIAYEYAKYLEPNWEWYTTKPTRDGGKDGESKIIEIETSFGQIIKKEAWYEAKYSSKPSRALPLSRVASTVLLGHNKRDTIEIIFIITNAKFSTSTIQEIKNVLGNKVNFVLGNELLEWLSKPEQRSIRRKYQLHSENYNDLIKINISNDFIISKSENMSYIVETKSEHLELDCIYNVTFTVYVPLTISNDYSFFIEEVHKDLELLSDNELNVSSGTNFVTIKVKAKNESIITEPIVTIIEKSSNETFYLNKRVEIKNIIKYSFAIQSQAQVEYDLSNKIDYFKQTLGKNICIVNGGSGQGKSHMLENILSSNIYSNTFYVKFRKNSKFDNSLSMIKLLVFLTFGKLFITESIDDEEIEQLINLNLYNKKYYKYLEYLIDEDNAFRNISVLKNISRELIPYSNNTSPLVIALDDLHFLDNDLTILLNNILKSLSTSNHNVFIIVTDRGNTILEDSLYDHLHDEVTLLQYTINFSINDVINNLKNYKIEQLPDQYLLSLSKNILLFKKFVNYIEINKYSSVAEVLNDSEIRNLIVNTNALNFAFKKLKGKEKEIVDLVYFFNSGIENEYLIDKYGHEPITHLLSQMMVKYDPMSKSYIPSHDTLLENISLNINYKCKHIFEYAKSKFIKNNKLIYLSILGIFPVEFTLNRDDFFNNIVQYHEDQSYYKVHYILERFFKSDIDFKSICDDYDLAKLKFYYAYSEFNVGKSNGLELFQDSAYYAEKSTHEESEIFKALALSEVANCHYWECNFKKIKDIYGQISKVGNKKYLNSPHYQKALITITCRYINSLLFLNHYDTAKHIYESFISLEEEFNLKELSHVLKADYTLLSFLSTSNESFSLLESLKEDSSLKVKTRFIAESQYLYASVVSDINQIENFRKLIYDDIYGKLAYNKNVIKLKLAICYALKEDHQNVISTLNDMYDIRSFPKLVLGAYYNLLALLELEKKNYDNAKHYLNKQLSCYENFGNDFKEPVKRNQLLLKTRPTEYSVGHKLKNDLTQSCFYIELRS